MLRQEVYVIGFHISDSKYIWTLSARLLKTLPQTENVTLGSVLGRDLGLRILVGKTVNL